MAALCSAASSSDCSRTSPNTSDSEYLHWGNLYEIAPFYVLIIVLMIKPYGLFGTHDIERI